MVPTLAAHAHSDEELARALADIVGDANIVTEEAERRFLSSDFFYWDHAGVVALAVAPNDVEELQAVMRALAGTGREIVVRGGGMSTGRSYVPQTSGAVLIDTRRLDRIRTINVVDRYMVVEAGCTWQQVVDALDPLGLRPDFTIPLSGSVSTVGGAMAHNVTGGMKGILGVEVVRANGDLIRTGSWSLSRFPEPYYRDYGPDLTGLFLGDTGAFGIKSAVSLHLAPKAESSAFASFTFSNMADQTRAMVALSACDYVTMRSGFDPYLTQIVLSVGFEEGLKTLASVARSESSVLRGLRRAAKIAVGGRGAMKSAEWTLHLRVDQLTQAAADEGIARARAICLKSGREIANSAAVGMGAGVLSVRGSVDRDGNRWIATNSIFPLSRAVDACASLQAFLDEHRQAFADHHVKVAIFTTCSALHFQIEPLFWWSDTVSELSLRNIPPAEAARFGMIPANPANRAFITSMRHKLRDHFEADGAIHVHTSKFFRYHDLLIPGTQRLLRDVKHMLDPDNVLNPGNLGISTASSE